MHDIYYMHLDFASPILISSTWADFYDSVKGETWPICINEHEFHSLPGNVKKEILEVFNGERFVKLLEDDITICPLDIEFERSDETPDRYLRPGIILSDDYDGDIECRERYLVAKDFSVLYDQGMFGFGTYHCQHYPRMIKYLYPNRYFKDCLEWCSGPGFIGFRLLSDGLIKSITMLDRHRPSLNACKKTWSNRPARLDSNSMSVVCGSTVSALGDKTFDFIVANPPNYSGTDGISPDLARLTRDPGLQAHTDFFLNIKKNLRPNGVILLLKGQGGSNPSDHKSAIEQGGLKINRIIIDKNCPTLYYLEVLHQ